MPKHRALPLATLTATAIATMLLLSVGVAYIGVTSYSIYLDEVNYRSLSPEAALAYKLVNEGQLPDADGLRAAIEHLDTLMGPTDLRIQIVTLVIGLLSASVCGIIGVFLARRIARPLEELTSAAETLRSGDFSARVTASSNSTREVTSLVETFNDLAASLDRMEQRLRFNNMAVAHELRTPLTVLQGALLSTAASVSRTLQPDSPTSS